jgi:hypothetical protein
LTVAGARNALTSLTLALGGVGVRLTGSATIVIILGLVNQSGTIDLQQRA